MFFSSPPTKNKIDLLGHTGLPRNISSLDVLRMCADFIFFQNQETESLQERGSDYF